MHQIIIFHIFVQSSVLTAYYFVLCDILLSNLSIQFFLREFLINYSDKHVDATLSICFLRTLDCIKKVFGCNIFTISQLFFKLKTPNAVSIIHNTWIWSSIFSIEF
jgi:hypothetical protein